MSTVEYERQFIRRRLRQRFMRAVRATLFPAPCLGCGAHGGALCVECAPALTERAVRPYARLASLVGQPAQTSSSIQLQSEFLDVGYIGLYAGIWREAILLLKNGRRDVADAFVDLLALRAGKIVSPAARDSALDGRLRLVGIPTSAQRRRERGFDGGIFLADGLGAAWGITAIPALRLAHTDHQRGKNRHARLQAQGRFQCTYQRPAAHVGVLLVDDVLTTGSTLRDACACLEERGIPVLGALTLAFVDG